MTILHIAHASDWADAAATGDYRISSRGASLDEVGFIHCSMPDQVGRVAGLFYADDPEPLVVLEIDESALDIRFEDSGTGELFPHIYQPLPVASVVGVIPARFAEGVFVY